MPNGYVYLKISGGLGNQLFMLACGLAYAQKYDRYLAIVPQTKYGKRSGYWDTFLSSWLNGETAPKNVVIVKHLEKNHQEIKEAGFEYTSLPPPKNHHPVLLRGYFQSERYFRQFVKDIVESFNPTGSLLFEIDMLEKSLLPKNCGMNYVSIHVRRGDYQLYPDQHPILPISYYHEALKRGKWSSKDTTLVVFSDDFNWCSETFRTQFDGFRVIIPENLTTEVSLILMSRCSAGHIVANSSFSWWGAFLGQQLSDRLVIAPTPWFGPSGPQNIQDLYLPDWILLNY